jgi:hypothetical protein
LPHKLSINKNKEVMKTKSLLLSLFFILFSINLFSMDKLGDANSPKSVLITNITYISATFTETNLHDTINTIISRGFEYKPSLSSWTNSNDAIALGIDTFSVTVNNLSPMTQYDVRSYIQTSNGKTYGNTYTFTTTPFTDPLIPSVTTLPPTNITMASAQLNGVIISDSNSILSQGFQWKLSDSTIWNIQQVSGTTISYILNDNMCYEHEYRAFATTANGTYYGNIVSFIALCSETLGEVITFEATEITDHCATLNGYLVSTGNAINNIELGFVYSPIANPILGEPNVEKIIVPYTQGMTDFSSPIFIPERNNNNSYFQKAYITNNAGTYYGGETIIFPGGIDNVNNKQIKIQLYPNPAKSSTKIIIDGVEEETLISICDIQGRKINSIRYSPINGKIEENIDLTNLTQGVYLINIKNANNSKTEKLIVF